MILGLKSRARHLLDRSSFLSTVVDYLLNPRQLTRADHLQFARDGFLTFDPGIPAHILEMVRTDLAGQFPRLPSGKVGYPLRGRIQDAWKTSQAVKYLARAPRVLAILKELYGRRPLPFQTLNFPVGTEQKIHSDTIHFNSVPAGWMCGVWIALEDMGMDNGPLVYYPGSHKLPEWNLDDLGIAPDSQDPPAYKRYELSIAELIERHALRPSYATIKKGQGFIWASNLLHGGTPRLDRNRSRYSQVTHYFFPGCQYYTPLLSSREKVCWREPRWIE